MPRLVSRDKQLPGGFQYRDVTLNYHARPWSSFNQIVNGLIAARVANPVLTQRNGWSTNYSDVANEVDFYEAKLAQAQGWKDYYVPDGGPATSPFSFQSPSMAQQIAQNVGDAVAGVKKLASGAALLFEWEDSGKSPVDEALANQRALVCVTCPKNTPQHLSRYFTQPIATMLRQKLARLHAMNLRTDQDEKLGICSACWCPLKLKVWTPFNLIQKHLKPEVRADLHPSCWILSEN